MHTPSLAQQIARLNALTEMGLLFDTVCRAWVSAPGCTGARLIHADGANRHQIRFYSDGRFHHIRASRPMRHRRPLDPLSYALESKKDTGIVVWTGDDDPPALPGGFPVITPKDSEHVEVANCFQCRTRAVMPLSWGHDVLKSVELGQSSSSAAAHEPMNLLDTNALVINVTITPDRIIEWAEWMCEHGFVLKHICAERMTRLLRHPHRDFWYDPEFSPSKLSKAERKYLKLWCRTKPTERKLAALLEVDPKTVAKTRRGLIERYGDNLHRLACRMGYMTKESHAPLGFLRSDSHVNTGSFIGSPSNAESVQFAASELKNGTV